MARGDETSLAVLGEAQLVRGKDQALPTSRVWASLDSEASILGGVILQNSALALVPSLEVEDFYHPRHQIVFAAMRELESQSKPIDVVTLEEEIERMGKLDAIGGVAFIGELALKVPTPENVEAYAEIVIGHRVTRDAVKKLSELLETARTGETLGEQLVHDVQLSMMHVRIAKERPVHTIAQLILDEGKRVMYDLEARARGEFAYAGVPSGIHAIDGRVGGWPVGLHSLVIARPAQGKSTFGMEFGRAAGEEGLLCSYEDSGATFGQRGLAQESGLSTEMLRARRVNSREDMAQLTSGMARGSQRVESFLACSGMSVEELVRRFRRENIRRQMAGRKRLRVLFIDYLQRIPIPKWARSREEGVSYISAQLTDLAAQDNVAVVSMCQLNRDLEKRDDKRPRLGDIRDSGSLEQDGKFILGIYYPRTYDSDADESDVRLLILKNHQGEAYGEINLWWDRATNTICNSQMEYHQRRIARGR